MDHHALALLDDLAADLDVLCVETDIGGGIAVLVEVGDLGRVLARAVHLEDHQVVSGGGEVAEAVAGTGCDSGALQQAVDRDAGVVGDGVEASDLEGHRLDGADVAEHHQSGEVRGFTDIGIDEVVSSYPVAVTVVPEICAEVVGASLGYRNGDLDGQSLAEEVVLLLGVDGVCVGGVVGKHDTVRLGIVDTGQLV